MSMHMSIHIYTHVYTHVYATSIDATLPERFPQKKSAAATAAAIELATILVMMDVAHWGDIRYECRTGSQNENSVAAPSRHRCANGRPETMRKKPWSVAELHSRLACLSAITENGSTATGCNFFSSIPKVVWRKRPTPRRPKANNNSWLESYSL